ncbi:MAG: type VI secretion system contractile sheath small subunit [Myxococcales bacterium]|nr:type VI secretion system contractile sheath small subunit [Myxococcales bacterium]MCB9548702.1 type VI secretion system contractile sheath small subunit [Myxococcales bacterium]
MADQTQHKIGRNRPPRVQITYDVEIGDAMEVKELPFIVGIMADLAGHADQPKLKERKFVQIDKDNFDEVLGSVGPSLSFTVPNKLDSTSEHIPVDLKFDRLGDFEPMAVVSKVDKLRETYERRNALNALLAKIYVNDDLASALNEVIRSTGSDEDLKKKLEELKGKL